MKDTFASARKIGANLWEVEPQFNFNNNEGGLIHQRHRRQRQRQRQRRSEKEKEKEKEGGLGLLVSDQLDEEPCNSDSQPVPVPVTPYACAVTPTGYTLKTSTHLLKVLKRIWNLEEQHSRNTVLIKSLKRDVEISQAQIKTLVEDRKMAHQEMDELKRSAHERKQKVVRSTKDELMEIKSKSLFMREKKARILLESLCDEFAKGIRDYEEKVRFLQQNLKDKSVSRNEPDRLILHVSEAWLDERAQMKRDISEKETSMSDNLCCEIEMFLEEKKKQSSGIDQVEKGNNIHEEKGSCGVITMACSPLVSRLIDGDHGRAEPSSSDLMSKRAPHGASPKPMADQDREASRQGVRANSLMAKLVEARLESQFSKSRTVTHPHVRRKCK